MARSVESWLRQIVCMYLSGGYYRSVVADAKVLEMPTRLAPAIAELPTSTVWACRDRLSVVCRTFAHGRIFFLSSACGSPHLPTSVCFATRPSPAGTTAAAVAVLQRRRVVGRGELAPPHPTTVGWTSPRRAAASQPRLGTSRWESFEL